MPELDIRLSCKWEIWVEGYAATGERAPARLVGTAWGGAFSEAASALCSRLDPSKWGRFDPDHLSLYGCRLFPTEDEARKAFG